MKIEKEWIDTPQAAPSASMRQFWWVQVVTTSRADHMADALPGMLQWCNANGDYDLMSAFKGKDGLWRFKAAKAWKPPKTSTQQLKAKAASGLKTLSNMD